MQEAVLQRPPQGMLLQCVGWVRTILEADPTLQALGVQMVAVSPEAQAPTSVNFVIITPTATGPEYDNDSMYAARRARLEFQVFVKAGNLAAAAGELWQIMEHLQWALFNLDRQVKPLRSTRPVGYHSCMPVQLTLQTARSLGRSQAFPDYIFGTVAADMIYRIEDHPGAIGAPRP